MTINFESALVGQSRILYSICHQKIIQINKLNSSNIRNVISQNTSLNVISVKGNVT